MMLLWNTNNILIHVLLMSIYYPSALNTKRKRHQNQAPKRNAECIYVTAHRFYGCTEEEDRHDTCVVWPGECIRQTYANWSMQVGVMSHCV